MKQLQQVVLTLCEDLDSARALSVSILIRYELWEEAQRLPPVHPSDFLDATSYLRAHAPGEFLRKLELPSDKRRLHDEAVLLFSRLERQNYLTNMRLSRFLPDSALLEHPDEIRICEFIADVKKDVSRLLGRLPESLTPRFSGGATVGDVGKLTTIPDKMSGSAQIYPSSTGLLLHWWETSWGRCSREHAPQVVRANTFFSVPKDSVKNRGCAKESSINVSYQLAVGKVLRSRLKSWGIDLDEGQELHRSLAREGSMTGKLATLDLSNASDTLAKNVVRLLLPKEWYDLLNTLRATHSNVEGRLHRLEKFSSMGNGFTFELETLIFAAVARRILRDSWIPDPLVKVYGDDIIVNTRASGPLQAALRFFGFEPNARKTHRSGVFRESCGGDFFGGVDVRPHYQKRIPSQPHEWIALANGLRRLQAVSGIRLRAWSIVVGHLPVHIRALKGPVSLGDIVVHDDERTWRPRQKRTGGQELRHFKCWAPIPLVLPWSHWRPEVMLAAVTLCDSEGITPRGGVTGYRTRWVQDPTNACHWLPSQT